VPDSGYGWRAFWPSPVPFCSARPLFEKLEILPVFSIYLLECCKFVRGFPKYFAKNRDIHDYDTRQRNDLYMPAQTSALSRKNPHSCMAGLYNLLPVSLKREARYTVFLKRLRAFVYEQRFYNYSEYLAYVSGHCV
jgi:hypothetical protein